MKFPTSVNSNCQNIFSKADVLCGVWSRTSSSHFQVNLEGQTRMQNEMQECVIKSLFTSDNNTCFYPISRAATFFVGLKNQRTNSSRYNHHGWLSSSYAKITFLINTSNDFLASTLSRSKYKYILTLRI